VEALLRLLQWSVLTQSATSMARNIRAGSFSSVELVNAHFEQIHRVNPQLNAVIELLSESALTAARAADHKLASGEAAGALHGVPFSVKDSMNVRGTKCTAGTFGRRNAPPALEDAAVVARLRAAGAIPIAKTNLPDLLFSFESDNLIYGRTNNPYDATRTSGGSSGGEAALITACGSPLGLGSDCAGSVRVPAAFCGIAGIKPTSGRLPRTGHVPAVGGWLEALWQIGPMARYTEDLVLALQLLSGEDAEDFTAPPVALLEPRPGGPRRVAFFVDNGFVRTSIEVQNAVRECATFLAGEGLEVEELRPPGMDHAYDLELALLGADGADGIDVYLKEIGSSDVHPLLTHFLDHMRPYRSTTTRFAARWAEWDRYRRDLCLFFHEYDIVLSPAYSQPALKHRESMNETNFRGFSYTMAWNLAGAPAATVRCGVHNGLPINVQVVAKPWRDLLALAVCQAIETHFGGWQAP
jgi:amidase